MTRYLVLQRRIDRSSLTRPAHEFFVRSEHHHRMLWADPVGDLIMAASGAAATLRPASGATRSERFADVARQRVALAEDVVVELDRPADGEHSFETVESTQPVRLLGGFAFDDGNAPMWAGFESGWLVLPEATVVESSDTVWVSGAMAIGTAPLADVRDTLRIRLDQVVAALCSDGASMRHAAMGSGMGRAEIDWSDDDAYVELVGRGVADIRSGCLDKVVLAREATVPESVDVAVLVDELQQRHPACTTYAFGVGDRTFVGATPERLVALDADGLRTSAVAGTAPRGLDADDDRRLGDDLLASNKDRAEHDFVVRAVHERLADIGVVCDAPGEPVVMKLASLQHLHTPIRGRIPSEIAGQDAVDVVRVAGALHPTPAVAGTPTDAAQQWIAANEAFDRGWYAAPIGWCDLDGHGEFNVGLRSALVTPDGVRLFAGAGIVSDSDPDKELAETTVKLDAVGSAIVVARTDGAKGRVASAA